MKKLLRYLIVSILISLVMWATIVAIALLVWRLIRDYF